MKRKIISFIMVFILVFFMTSCNSYKDTTTVKDGTYILEDLEMESVILPKVTISEGDISFTYDSLSSYLPVGVYSIEEDILTMLTNDRLHKYVFRIDKNKLIFQKNESSGVKLTDDKIGIEIRDNAEFKLKEN